MSDVDPLGNAYCKEHDIYLCSECEEMTHKQEIIAKFKAKIAELNEIYEEFGDAKLLDTKSIIKSLDNLHPHLRQFIKET